LAHQAKATLERRAAPGGVLHARQVGFRTGHKPKISRRFLTATRRRPKTDHEMDHEMDTARKSGPILDPRAPRGPEAHVASGLRPTLRRAPAVLPEAPALRDP